MELVYKSMKQYLMDIIGYTHCIVLNQKWENLSKKILPTLFVWVEARNDKVTVSVDNQQPNGTLEVEKYMVN